LCGCHGTFRNWSLKSVALIAEKRTCRWAATISREARGWRTYHREEGIAELELGVVAIVDVDLHGLEAREEGGVELVDGDDGREELLEILPRGEDSVSVSSGAQAG
jgi:hypothetical protein